MASSKKAAKSRSSKVTTSNRGNARQRDEKNREPMQSAMAHGIQANREMSKAGPEQMRRIGQSLTEATRDMQRRAAEQMSQFAEITQIAATAPVRLMQSWTQVWANWARAVTRS